MKTVLISLSAAFLASAAMAATPVNRDVVALRYECAQQQAAKRAEQLKDGKTFVFVYQDGKYKGEVTESELVECSGKQYAAFLSTVDPVRLQAAYPTAAGRAAAVAKQPK
jgi:hypothetical protein